MRDIKISSNYTLLLIIILSVSIGFAIYFATKILLKIEKGLIKS